MVHLTANQINQYLDHTLDEVTIQRLEAHLHICRTCRQQVQEMEALFASLVELPDITLRRDLTAAILERLPQGNHTKVLWHQPAFILQSLLTIILLFTSMSRLHSLSQEIMEWGSKIMLPELQIPSLTETINHLAYLFSWRFELSFRLPPLTFEVPMLPILPPIPQGLDGNLLLVMAIATGILWLVGNISLLKSTPQVGE